MCSQHAALDDDAFLKFGFIQWLQKKLLKLSSHHRFDTFACHHNGTIGLNIQLGIYIHLKKNWKMTVFITG